jgi:hypothetical protein
MEQTDPEACVLCGAPAVDAPRIFIRQELALDAAVAHRLAFCPVHAERLRAGQLTPQQIIYAWATRMHGDLYRNERLVLLPELRCLACNAALSPDRAVIESTAPPAARPATPDAGDAGDAPGAEIACARCGAINELGSALGHCVAVRLRALASP